MDMTFPSAITQVVRLEEQSQVGEARRCAQKLADSLGLDATDGGRVALVATELASNVLKHAGHGELHLRALPHPEAPGVELLAVDRGNGFDVHACMADGFSTRGTQGIGMGALARQSEVFDVHSDSRGSVVLARLYKGRSQQAERRLGVTQHSLHDDPACGDAWQVSFSSDGISVLVVDGLGHGEEAEKAAGFGCQAFGLAPFARPEQVLEDMHQAMNGSRGGAAALAQYLYASEQLHFAGIGNIGACLVSPGKTRGLASHPGIVGAQFRRVQPFSFNDCTGQLLVMYSDGLQSRWNLIDYPGLVHRHPAVIATVLHRDFCRGRDDVTVVVIALEPAHV
nr:SpoIIE family protein phosphatase [Pseudomonas sp. UBA4194]